MGVMVARRLCLLMVASLCGLAFACALTGAVAPEVAVAAQFGSQGQGAGQFEGPAGVALNRSTGDVYIPDRYNYRLDEFDSSGNFLSATGWSVNQSSPAEEVQMCTTATGCKRGNSGRAAGQFTDEGPQAIAVDDNEPLSDLSAGDVYVVDFDGFRVEKFNAEGKFLLMFGGGVNETSGIDVCLAGEQCTHGTPGTGDGQFEWAFNAHGIIAVGPGGAVYVGDKARIEVFESSGAWRENISLAGLSSEGQVTSIAVNSAGDIFVKIQGVPGVHEFDPSGAEAPVKLDEGSEAVEGLTLDQAGDLFVADSTGGFHVMKYDSAGKHIDTFGSKTVGGTRGIAFSDALGELYVTNTSESNVWILPAPTSAGPWIDPGSESASPGLRGAATFAASVNPEGGDASYHVEYVDDAQFRASSFAGASSTPAAPVGAPSEDFEDHRVEASLPAKTLVAGTTYHWRVVVSDTEGHTALGTTESFEEAPAARVEGPWAADVASTSATLAAQIDPLSSSTDYRLEWGTSTAYGHVYSGNVGEGIGYVPVGGFHIQGLEPGTTYHYRLITTNEIGTIESADHSFTTQIGGNELTLPDGRAWELVSPADKHGALIRPNIALSEDVEVQAAADGDGIVYDVSDVIGEDPTGKSNVTRVLSARGPSGWRTVDISIPDSLPLEEAETIEEGPGSDWLSSDLSLAATEQERNPVAPLSREATERTPYLRNNLTCVAQPETCYTPLVTARDVEPLGTPFGGTASASGAEVNILGATPDLSHIIIESPYALKAGAVSGRSTNNSENLYEWNQGGLQLVNVLPDHTSEPGAMLGYKGAGAEDVTAHSISSDGRRIVWSYGTAGSGSIELFVRDMDANRTIKVGGVEANFQTMSSDGTRIFYREHGELYEVNFETGAQMDLTTGHGAGEVNAGVQDAVLGASEDGSYVYFVATGVLASGATSGADNLYVLHDGAGGWSTTHIATLSAEDERSWFASAGESSPHCDCGGVVHARVTSRVSNNGRFVSFMSSRPLTGYDNIDAVSGRTDEEVYLYDAVANRLVCVSCDPTGARPVGVLDGRHGLLVDPSRAWAGSGGEEGAEEGSAWLAGMIPSWSEIYALTGATSYYQPRFLSDSGRMFFDSPDGLVPQATNGLMNVYEYEPAGVGNCTNASSTFSERTDGCVSLISPGTSSSESDFYDASENGDDVFFITASRLTPEDYDTAYDVYDARVCSTSAPCTAAAVSPPPCTSGDSCKAAPSPQPEVFGPPPSATFSGAGNVTQAPPATGVSPRSLTAAQKLARALRTCQKKKRRKPRSACERQARKRYGAARSRKANATRKGNR
jgi:hypothetical protein